MTMVIPKNENTLYHLTMEPGSLFCLTRKEADSDFRFLTENVDWVPFKQPFQAVGCWILEGPEQTMAELVSIALYGGTMRGKVILFATYHPEPRQHKRFARGQFEEWNVRTGGILAMPYLPKAAEKATQELPPWLSSVL